MEQCIKIRSRYCNFEPPSSFRTDIFRYHGIRCEDDIEAPAEHPLFHSAMSPRTLKAYLRWRTLVWDRKAPSAD